MFVVDYWLGRDRRAARHDALVACSMKNLTLVLRQFLGLLRWIQATPTLGFLYLEGDFKPSQFSKVRSAQTHQGGRTPPVW